MNYHAHRIGGICSGLAFSIITMPETNAIPYVALMTTSALVGSLLPDIDEPNSFIGKKVKPISKIIKWTAGHRGLFHTFLICLIFPMLYFIARINPQLQEYLSIIGSTLLGLAIGYLSHLLMDMMTVSGVPLFWPFIKKKISILSLKTNRDEWLAILIFIFMLICAIEWRFHLITILLNFLNQIK